MLLLYYEFFDPENNFLRTFIEKNKNLNIFLVLSRIEKANLNIL